MCRKLFGKAEQQPKPAHPFIIYQPVNGVIVNLFKKIFDVVLHPVSTFALRHKDKQEIKSTDTPTLFLTYQIWTIDGQQ